MNRLKTILKYFILFVSYVSCDPLPLRVIELVESFPCFALEGIQHDLELDPSITDNLNRICWLNVPNDYAQYYLGWADPSSRNPITIVDVPFVSRQIFFNFLRDKKLGFVVHTQPEIWNITGTFPEFITAQNFFNQIYGEFQRQQYLISDFIMDKIETTPNLDEAGTPFANLTFIHVAKDFHNSMSFIFTPEQINVSNPILIFSSGEFQLGAVDGETVPLHLHGDLTWYILHFRDNGMAQKFSQSFSKYAFNRN